MATGATLFGRRNGDVNVSIDVVGRRCPGVGLSWWPWFGNLVLDRFWYKVVVTKLIRELGSGEVLFVGIPICPI